MKKNIERISIIIFFVCSIFIFLPGCEKDELKYVEDNVQPLISVTNTTDNKIEVNSNNSIINKEAKTVTVRFGINRSGIQEKDAFAVDLSVNTTNLPSGAVALTPADYKIYSTDVAANSVSRLDVPSGSTSAPLAFTISKTVLDANPGKQLAVNVVISNPSKFGLNPSLTSATIIVNVASFGEKAIDVTSSLKNPGGSTPFLRSDGGTSRFGILKDWTVNDAVKNIDNNTKGGFDSNGGGAYMAMERWGTPAIPNGKIYQTLTLPKGKYSFEVDFQGAGISNEAYLTIAAGTILPNVADISSAIASSSYSTPKVQFQLTEQKEVSIGILANLINDYQWFRIRGVKLYKFESPFN